MLSQFAARRVLIESPVMNGVDNVEIIHRYLPDIVSARHR